MHYDFFGALVDAFLALLTFVEAGAAGDFVALEEIANAPIATTFFWGPWVNRVLSDQSRGYRRSEWVWVLGHIDQSCFAPASATCCPTQNESGSLACWLASSSL
jgi:hypothetical protein